MKKKLVFLGLICLSLFAFIGCGTEKLDISNCIDVRYGEFNGSAKIYESSLDLGKLQDIPKLKGLTPDMLKGDYKITLVGDKKDLKNGDKVKLHLEYNKELYKRDFNVEFKFEPTEVTIEGLPDKLTNLNQISKEQWNEIYSSANEYFQNIAKEKKFNNVKLERVLKFEDNNPGEIDIGFIYSYKSNNTDPNYICLNDSLKFKVNNDLEYNNFSINLALDSIWFNKFFIDYSRPLNEILNNIYNNVYKCKYSILWSAEN